MCVFSDFCIFLNLDFSMQTPLQSPHASRRFSDSSRQFPSTSVHQRKLQLFHVHLRMKNHFTCLVRILPSVIPHCSCIGGKICGEKMPMISIQSGGLMSSA